MAAAWINTAGLTLDIAGVVLLYRFGLPSRVRESGLEFFGWKSPEALKEYERARTLSRTGLILLILGFALQATSNWVGR